MQGWQAPGGRDQSVQLRSDTGAAPPHALTGNWQGGIPDGRNREKPGIPRV
jgi:hypothetical protein